LSTGATQSALRRLCQSRAEGPPVGEAGARALAHKVCCTNFRWAGPFSRVALMFPRCGLPTNRITDGFVTGLDVPPHHVACRVAMCDVVIEIGALSDVQPILNPPR
jgi:hypothetical protein